MKRIAFALARLNRVNRAFAFLVLCGTTALDLPAQTFTTLYSFDSTNGANPYAGLVQATNGNLYGTTHGGGSSHYCNGGCGTVFDVTPTGSLTMQYSFCSQSDCLDGGFPYAGWSKPLTGTYTELQKRLAPATMARSSRSLLAAR